MDISALRQHTRVSRCYRRGGLVYMGWRCIGWATLGKSGSNLSRGAGIDRPRCDSHQRSRDAGPRATFEEAGHEGQSRTTRIRRRQRSGILTVTGSSPSVETDAHDDDARAAVASGLPDSCRSMRLIARSKPRGSPRAAAPVPARSSRFAHGFRARGAGGGTASRRSRT